MADGASSERDRVRTAEIIATLSLATDLAVGFPLEHGLRSAVIAMRICDRLEVDAETASQTYFLSLLFYVGCTAPVDVGSEVFGSDDGFVTYAIPARFGSRAEMARGMMRAVAPIADPPHVRAWRVGRYLPTLALRFPGVVAATCEVARMLTERLGLGSAVANLFAFEDERWDGKGLPAGVAAEGIPPAVRIVHVARDAAFQRILGDDEFVAGVIGRRAGAAFDPTVAGVLAGDAAAILSLDEEDSLWDLTLAAEPKPWLTLGGEDIDGALAAIGDFSDMAVPDLVGHSGGVAAICRAAAGSLALDEGDSTTLQRAALVHDLGRVAVPVRIWEKPGPLSADEWEQVRLHAYHTERILHRSPFLAGLAPVASLHHERLDGSGYHRGEGAPALDPMARLLAVADTYHAMIEPRPHRPAHSPEEAARIVTEGARAGRFDPEAVSAVLEAVGHPRPSIERPAGLTRREVEVVKLLARGRQTKQVARALDISVKTADFHIQSAYRKMDVTTRAGATLFAMQHGLVTWENSR